jgi:hypothetical protein
MMPLRCTAIAGRVALKMTRTLLVLSFLIFDMLLYDWLWGGRWVSRSIDEVLGACAGVVWLGCVYVLLRSLRLPREAKVGSWLLVLLFSGYMLGRTFSRYVNFSGEPFALWIEVNLLLLLFLVAVVVLAKWLLPERKPGPSAPYTVESETPDHVLQLGAAPPPGERDRPT